VGPYIKVMDVEVVNVIPMCLLLFDYSFAECMNYSTTGGTEIDSIHQCS